MKYILQNSSPKLLLKLYQCCKYFYFKLKKTIALNVWYQNYHEKKQMEFTFFKKNGFFFYPAFPNVEKLWLCDKLHINMPTEPSRSYGLIGNVFLNKIYRNNLKELSIYSGFTLFKELKILLKSPFLTNVDLSTSVKNENDESIPFEEITVLFPNKIIFSISPTHFTMESLI